MRYIFLAGLALLMHSCLAQGYKKEPEAELSLGIRAIVKEIVYGKNHMYVTDPTSISLQTMVRYNSPVKIFKTRYIDVVGQAGFLFCKAKVFDTAFIDPDTNMFTYYRSHNPTYMPFYFGIYNMSAFSIGTEIFFWKCLGKGDIWGIKFLSLGYSGRQFRFAVAGEVYSQLNNRKNSGTVFSFDFYLKLVKGG